MGKCYLCNLEKPLIEAHIIPKWAYKYLYPEDGNKKSLILVSKTAKPIKRPIGSYDPKILCADCDNFIGVYDGYAKIILIDSPLEQKDKYSVIKNVNRIKFTLFVLSVIWRASISKLPENNRIKLGPYEEKLRDILLSAKNGSSNPMIINFPFVVTKFAVGKLPSDVVNKNIQTPHTERLDGLNMAVFYMPNGYKIFTKTDKRPFNSVLQKMSGHWQEGLFVLNFIDYETSKEYRDLLKIV